MVVMVAGHAGVNQLTLQKGFHSGIRIALCACADLNAGLSQSALSAAADAAADQHIDGILSQQPGQRAVAAAVSAHHFAGQDPAILHLVDLEVLGLAEVLEYFSVLIGYRNFHSDSPYIST